MADTSSVHSVADGQAPSPFVRWWIRLVPCLLVFMSAFCLMVMELVAPRLVARHLGSSIYTWTSVIGVVLAGLGLGNYIGGRLADRFSAQRLLPLLFLISSITVLSTVWLNELLGQTDALREVARRIEVFSLLRWIADALRWFPLQVFLVITGVFFVPSVALGTISPVAAKMALEQSERVGATIGNIYAWGQIGAIAGTFTAGYVLIAQLGCFAVLTLTSAVLALIAVCLTGAGVLNALWAGAVVALNFMAVAPESVEWAVTAGEFARVRPRLNEEVVYFDESEYYTIVVKNDPLSVPGTSLRTLILDSLIHGFVHPTNPLHLEYEYEQTYVAILKKAGYLPEAFELPGNDEHDQDEQPIVTGRPIRCLFLGGGAYTFPRFIDTVLPGSEIVVAEIDPAVTRAARRALFLESNPRIKIIHGDARITVRRLLEDVRAGRRPPFDCIFGDAFNDLSVPYHLTTREFNEQLRGLLTRDGIYLMNIIDDFDHAGFLGALINTAQRVFPVVEVFATQPVEPEAYRDTFVVLMANRPIDLADVPPADGTAEETEEDEEDQDNIRYYRLTSRLLEVAVQRAGNIVLTDDYAPVENLLAPVASERY